MRVRVVLVVCAIVVALVGAPAGVAAQTDEDLADELNRSGVVRDSGAEGSRAAMERVVDDAAAAGLSLALVSLADDVAGAESLARRLMSQVGGTVVVVTPGTLAGASDRFDDATVGRSLDAFSAAGGGDAGFAALADSLETAAGGTTSTAPAPATDDGSGGGSLVGVLVVIAVIVGVIVVVVVVLRARNRRRVRDEMATRTEVVGAELAEIGAEILELEDRVAFEEHDEATRHFRTGNQQFLELQDRLAAATSLWDITQVDYAADTAAWHLDAAEALLDDEPVPEEPDRPDLRVSRPPAEPVTPADDARVTDEPAQQPSRRVEPRTRRRTGWNAPTTTGGGMGDLLSSVLVGSVLRGGGGGRTRAPNRWPGGGSLGDLMGSASRSRGGSASRSRGGSASRRR